LQLSGSTDAIKGRKLHRGGGSPAEQVNGQRGLSSLPVEERETTG
jgi:hypothetical protein